MARHMRWLRLITFTALLAPFSAGATQLGMAPPNTVSGRVGGITTGPGPVMTGRVNVYVIYYGYSAPESPSEQIVDYFISHWGASHSYGMLRSYTGSNGRVAPQLALAGVSLDSGSRGTKLTDADIRALVSNAIQNNTFPADANGIYAVIFARTDVTQSASFGSLCKTYCGYHSTMNVNGVDIKFILDGAGNVAGGSCEGCRDAYEPNGTWADAVVNTLSHEIAETVTDPDLNAWGSGASNDEVGDKCNFNFAERHNDPNAFPATAKVGRRYFDIQQLWSPVAGGSCLSGYSSPPAVLFQASTGGPIVAWRPPAVALAQYTNIPAGQISLTVGDFSNGIDPQVLTIDSAHGGPVTMWTLHSNSTATSQVMFDQLGPGWTVRGTGDLNGDGFSDIVFTNPGTGDNELYFMKGTTLLSYQELGNYLPWLPMATADFNGDGLADIFWVDAPDQLYSIWLSSVSPGVAGVSFSLWGPADMSPGNFGHPVHGVLGVADFNGDTQADVLYLPFNWASQGLGDGILTGDYLYTGFEPIHIWVANSIFPDFPTAQGVLDLNRDGTSDFYLAGPSGVTFFTMGGWKDWPRPIYGPLIDSDPDTDLAVAGQGPTFSVSGMNVIGAGTFKEN